MAAAAGVGLCARGALPAPGQKPQPSVAHNGSAVLPFDAGRAFEHVRQLVAIGPRPAGSPGIEAARRYIRDQIAAIGLSATERAFDAQTPVGPLKIINLSVVIPGARPDRLLIGDTTIPSCSAASGSLAQTTEDRAPQCSWSSHGC